MSGTTTLILGGGWGGLTAAHHLRGLLPREHRIVVVERSDTFGLGVSNLWLMTGEREGLDQVRRDMHMLKSQGIEWVHAEASSFDPETRTVDTAAGRLQGDYVVLALGAALAPEAVPGFSEAAFNLYEAEASLELHAALERFEGGKIVVLVAGAPFRCPAAPYEAGMLIEAMIRNRGVRDQIELSLYTPEPHPMLVAGPAVGEALEGMLRDRGIAYHPQRTLTSVDPESRTIHFEEETVPCDLLVGIPPHRAPTLMAEAGLIDDSGYVPVHPQTLEILSDPETLDVQYPGVFAIGDVTAVRLLNSMLLPKAGVFAEAQAQVVAASIAAKIRGELRPHGYDGYGFCYVEVGDGLAAYGSGDFYAYPGPRVTLETPSIAARRTKEEYEQVLDTWFRV
jgi:sulfide:quinone oxidoreductase